MRELSHPNQQRIQLGMSMEEKGHPFYQMPEELSEGAFQYASEESTHCLGSECIGSARFDILSRPTDDIRQKLDGNDGQLSDAMRNNALIALTIALASILITSPLRFEFKYAVGAVVGLAFVVAVSLGVLAIFHALGSMVQIDLQVVGAIMTIIGYALNDTIIVFDRIREDVKLFRKLKFSEVINRSLNVTLSRTLMTSGTTLVVLLTLVLLAEARFMPSLSS